MRKKQLARKKAFAKAKADKTGILAFFAPQVASGDLSAPPGDLSAPNDSSDDVEGSVSEDGDSLQESESSSGTSSSDDSVESTVLCAVVGEKAPQIMGGIDNITFRPDA